MITFEEQFLGKEEKRLLHEAIANSSVNQGKYVKKFESLFSSYCNTKFGCASFNGTTALHLALAALGIKKGDEVIVPSFTFVATANVASYLGATPVFADIEKETLCIDPESIKNKITKKTKAILPVHVFGYPCDMDIINKIAAKNNLFVVEDAAEAHGATYKGKKAGSLSDIGCFSFYANKIISTGEGGMCITNKKEFHDKMALLRAQGKVKSEDLKEEEFIEKGYYHEILGFNYRMLDLQAAIGIAQMKKIDEKIKARRKLASLYDKEFSKYNTSSAEKSKDTEPSYWVYPLIFESKKVKLNVGKELMKKNIPFLPFFWPCHKQPFYNKNETLPITEEISEKGIVISCNPRIKEEEALDLVRTIVNASKNA